MSKAIKRPYAIMVRVPKELEKKIRVRAKERGETFATIIRDALLLYLYGTGTK